MPIGKKLSATCERFLGWDIDAAGIMGVLALLKQDLESHTTLFRANSMGTKSLDAYMKFVGKEYLKTVLQNPIDLIFEERKDCEVGSRTRKRSPYQDKFRPV